MINVEILDNMYKLTFQYDPEYVEFCKNLQGSRYKPDHKAWLAERNVPNAIDLKREGFYDDKDILTVKFDTSKSLGHFEWKLKGIPFTYQNKFADWSSNRIKSMLVAEMGLGKTFMAFQWLASMKANPNDVVVVSPISIVDHWVDQARTFTNSDITPVTGSSTIARLKKAETPGFHAVNYEFVALNKEAFKIFSKKKIIILDESHKIKCPSTTRSKIMHKLCAEAKGILMLTGTPVSQGAQDYYSQIKCIEKNLLGYSYTSFKHRYCLEEQIRNAPIGVRRIVGYKNLEELVEILNPYVFTLLKKDCLDLPEKIYTRRYVELGADQRRAYNQLRDNMITWLDSGDKVTTANILTRLIRFSQITQGFIKSDLNEEVTLFESNPKLKDLAEYVEDLLPGEPFVVMCRFREDINQVKKLMDKLGITACQLHGDVPVKDRFDIVNEFKAGRYRALVGQIRVAGVGYNMEHCKKMYFFSNEYSLTDRLQAEDRIHRATSVGDACVYTDVVAKDTVDLDIIKALRSKKNVADMLHEIKQHFNKE